MRILVDMDGVLSDFENGFLKNWRRRFPHLPHIPIHQRTTYWLADQYPPELLPSIRDICTSPNFFLGMQPIPGGKSALDRMLQLNLEVFICTTPLSEYRNCVLEKFEWVERHLGKPWTQRIILAKDKTLIRGDFLIDDRPDVEGSDFPSWEHILFDQPYNRSEGHKRRLDWNTWQSILLEGMGGSPAPSQKSQQPL